MSKICQITGKKAMRYINKVGLDAALKNAVAQGYCDWKEIRVIG